MPLEELPNDELEKDLRDVNDKLKQRTYEGRDNDLVHLPLQNAALLVRPNGGGG